MNKEIPIALFKTEDNKFIKYVRYEELNKYKEVLDKINNWLCNNTHYTDLDVKVLVQDDNTNLKELMDILEEIE